MRTGVVLAVLLVVSAGGCASGEGSRSEDPTSTLAALAEDGALPRPKGAPILTIRGNISRPNTQDEVVLDLETIERLHIIDAEIFEPFLQERATFRGVELSTLLEVVGAEPSSGVVRLTALDDYEVALPADGEGILLATRHDGALIPVDEGGPTRIVFLSDSTGGENLAHWIWSVSSIEVR